MKPKTLERIELPKRELTKEEIDLLYNNGKSIDYDKMKPKNKERYCVKCGTEKNLKKYDVAYFKMSENSNPNVIRFENCYVCKGCKSKMLKPKNNHSVRTSLPVRMRVVIAVSMLVTCMLAYMLNILTL